MCNLGVGEILQESEIFAQDVGSKSSYLNASIFNVREQKLLRPYKNPGVM